jgi:pimeloyl-ACP methyl ester carboxylesterase
MTVASTLEGATIAEIARNILRHAPPSFALAGISMGGYIAFEIMRQAPERVSRLALLDTSARADTPDQSAARRAAVEEARAGDFEQFVAQTISAIVHPHRRDDPTLRAIGIRMALTFGAEGYARQTEAIIGRPDSRAGLGSISVPTLVLVGDHDALTPPERSREIAAAIPGAKLVVVPDCGHASTIERPEAVNRALIEWISARA